MTKPEMILLWLDLETTGLSPVYDEIIEVATIITKRDLVDIVCIDEVVQLGDPDAAIANMNNYVTAMHMASGLITDLYDPVKAYLNLAAIEHKIIRQLDSQGAIAGEKVQSRRNVMMAGSSVKFDYGFVEVHMPKLFTYLHYRVVDVSNLYTLYPQIFPRDGDPCHRAADDIKRSKQMLADFDTLLRIHNVI